MNFKTVTGVAVVAACLLPTAIAADERTPQNISDPLNSQYGEQFPYKHMMHGNWANAGFAWQAPAAETSQQNLASTFTATLPSSTEQELSVTTTTSGFASPLASALNVSSGFGSRIDPTGFSGTQHDGIDLTGALGETVMAARDGVVVAAYYGASEGNCVIIQHDNGYYSYYMHLSAITVQQGQSVATGQQIGAMGTTGNSTGVHLHFGLSTALWSGFVDPALFLNL